MHYAKAFTIPEAMCPLPTPEQNHHGAFDNLQAHRIDIHRYSRSGEYLSGLPELYSHSVSAHPFGCIGLL